MWNICWIVECKLTENPSHFHSCCWHELLSIMAAAPSEPDIRNFLYRHLKDEIYIFISSKVRSDSFFTVTTDRKDVKLQHYQSNSNWHHYFPDCQWCGAPLQTSFNWSDGFFRAVMSPWISLLTHYESSLSCLLHWLSGVSKVSLDRFQIVLCLSVCPWAPKGEGWIVKDGEKKKPFHFLDWSLKRVALTCHDSNSIISATPVSPLTLQMML